MAQEIAILKKKGNEFCKTVLKFLRSNVSSRALYIQKLGRGSIFAILMVFKKRKSAHPVVRQESYEKSSDKAQPDENAPSARQ